MLRRGLGLPGKIRVTVASGMMERSWAMTNPVGTIRREVIEVSSGEIRPVTSEEHNVVIRAHHRQENRTVRMKNLQKQITLDKDKVRQKHRVKAKARVVRAKVEAREKVKSRKVVARRSWQPTVKWNQM